MSHTLLGHSLTPRAIGRVAAGAIAERYLKQAHGVEIVAFVSSVGKINIPASVGSRAESTDDETDDAEDALTPEFRKLLSSVTREIVDKHPTRCPHPETAERMTKVCASDAVLALTKMIDFFYSSASSARKRHTIPLAGRSPA